MWNPVSEWRAFSSIHGQPTKDDVDGPNNILQVWDDSDVNADGNYCEGDPAMIDPLKIEQEYSRDQHRCMS